MPDPTVRELLLARVDELVDRMTRDLEEIRAVTEQLDRSGPGLAATPSPWRR